MATVDLDPSPNAELRPAALPRMTEAEFVAWCDEETRAEWVDGEVVLMNAVGTGHGLLLTFLNRLVGNFGEAYDLGQVLNDPVAIRLPRQRRRRQPDLFFIGTGKADRILDDVFEGPPDLIVEIVSPDSRHRDAVVKFAEYEAAGVPEYWLADPPMRMFDAFTLGADGKYVRIPDVNGVVYSACLPGLFFRVEWVWQLPFPKVPPLLAEMAAERALRLGSSPPPP